MLKVHQPVHRQFEYCGNFLDVGFLYTAVGINPEAAGFFEVDHPTAWEVVIGVVFE